MTMCSGKEVLKRFDYEVIEKGDYEKCFNDNVVRKNDAEKVLITKWLEKMMKRVSVTI
jgi:hypothetical protein